MKLPVRFSDNFGEPLRALFQLLADINTDTDSKGILLDYSDALFTNPFFTLALPLVVKINERKGKNIQFENGFKNPGTSDYMGYIAFPDGICPEKIADFELENYFDQYKLKTYIPILDFPADERGTEIRDKTLSVINAILTQQIGLKGVMRTAVMYLIDEAVNNIIHHSKDARGYIFAQYYRSKGYMDICIADIGNTLLDSYSSSGRHDYIINHKDAMEAALHGKSTKSNNLDRGFGISTSKKMLTEGLNGKYFLFSANTFNIHTATQNDVVILPKNSYWQGVYVAMRIPTVAKEGFNPAEYYE